MTHEKALIFQRRDRTKRRRRIGMKSGESGDLPEQHVSAVSFPILTEADYRSPSYADTFGTDS